MVEDRVKKEEKNYEEIESLYMFNVLVVTQLHAFAKTHKTVHLNRRALLFVNK